MPRVNLLPTQRANPPEPIAALREWARIVQYPDGTLAAFAVRAVEGGQAVCGWHSVDGQAWDGPCTLVALPRRHGLWGGLEALVDRDGEVHLFLLNDLGTGVLGNTAGEEAHPEMRPGEHRLDLWHLRSGDGRRTWPAPRRIWTGYTGSLNSVLQLRSGRILLPFSYLLERTWSRRGEGLEAFTFMGTYVSSVVYSDDAGENWGLSPTPLAVPVPDITYAYGAVEPVALELHDGRVWMLIRTQMGRFYESYSDDGAAWSAPRPTAIISSDSPAGLARLADGRIVLLWNNCLRHPYAYGGRQVLHAAVSDDEGHTWTGYREVARDPHRDEPPPPHGDHGTAYPFPTPLRDGTLLFTTGQGEGRVQISRLHPDWLCETREADDFAGGLEAWSVFGTRGVELVTHPDRRGWQALRLARVDDAYPACAVRNFPLGMRGTLRLRLRCADGFRGRLGLADHFSTPFDPEDRFHNLFNYDIAGVTAGWQTLTLRWDMARRRCQVTRGGRRVATLPLLHDSPGPCYLRLHALAGELWIASLQVEIGPVIGG